MDQANPAVVFGNGLITYSLTWTVEIYTQNPINGYNTNIEPSSNCLAQSL